MNFNQIIKKEEILRVLEENNFEHPTPIQEQIMPLIIDGNDVLGKSQTGTGKTLAFAGPILETIEENKNLQTLILAPTRELAIQISREIEEYAKYTKLSTTCVYGSSSIEDQIRAIKKGPEIVIGTPGRVKDLIKRKVLKLTEIKYFVLDEADEMLSMGFQEELEFIFEQTNNDRQVLLFSATMPKTILKMAEKYMSREYRTITIESSTTTADNITQDYYLVNDKTRLESMCRVIDYYNPNKAIIFCRTKRNADEVLEKLTERGYRTDVIHGDITQGQRIATLDKFKLGVFQYLIATDVAARGIHVDDVELVINYNLPESNEAYVHRIGRTGRANKSGIAVTFVNNREEKIIYSVERHTKSKITKKELPKLEEVIPTRVSSIIEDTNKLKETTSKLNLFKEYTNSLTKEELENILNNILEKRITEKLGSNFNTDVSANSDKKKKRNNKELQDSVRVFMTIGKLDNIQKRDFLCYIEKTANIPEGTCSNVEIMSKFTFMNVKKEYANQVIDKINDTKYNDRVIKIEKAKH